MKTVADFKRKVKTHKNWHLESWWFTGPRQVKFTDTIQVGFTSPRAPGVISYLNYPKRSECSFERGGILIKSFGGKTLFYRPIED